MYLLGVLTEKGKVDMYLDIDEFRRVISEKYAEMEKEKVKKKYDKLQEEFGINRWYLWNIINKPNYEPPAWIYAHLGIPLFASVRVCSACGQVHNFDRACEMQVVVKPKPKPKKQKKRYPRYYAWLFEQF